MPQRVSDVSELKNQFLLCREKCHHWSHVTDHVTKENPSTGAIIQIERVWHCKTCKTNVFEQIAVPSFNILSRKYEYPDGYLITRSIDDVRVTKQAVRRERAVRSGLIKRPR